MDEPLKAILRGRKLKKILRMRYSGLRKKYGLTQLDVELLQYFDQNPGAAASDVIRELDLNKGNVSTAMFKLFRDGMVDGEPNDHDRRIIEYRLKEKGSRIIREADKIREDFVESLFQDVTEEEKEVLHDIAVKVLNNLKRIDQEMGKES